MYRGSGRPAPHQGEWLFRGHGGAVAHVARRIDGLAVVPAAFLAHNAEEVLSIPIMLPRVQAKTTSLLGGWATVPSAEQYLVALAVLTAAASALWLLALRWASLSYALVVLQAAMAVNALSHLGGAVLLGGCAPGVVAAVLVEAVVSVVVYRRITRAGWMSRRQWVLLPVLALVLHGPVLCGAALLFGSS